MHEKFHRLGTCAFDAVTVAVKLAQILSFVEWASLCVFSARLCMYGNLLSTSHVYVVRHMYTCGIVFPSSRSLSISVFEGGLG